MNLNELKNRPGATKDKKRAGRGPGSGIGKTGGRGVKGQKSRSGVAINGFEGGQMPIYRRLPKRGFNNFNSKNYAVINLSTLQAAVDKGVLKAGDTVNEESLKAAGVVTSIKDGVRLLGKGELKAKLNIEVAGASASARQAVEKAGGSLTVAAPKAETADSE